MESLTSNPELENSQDPKQKFTRHQETVITCRRLRLDLTPPPFQRTGTRAAHLLKENVVSYTIRPNRVEKYGK